MISLLQRVENIVGKGENAGYPQFLCLSINKSRAYSFCPVCLSVFLYVCLSFYLSVCLQKTFTLAITFEW